MKKVTLFVLVCAVRWVQVNSQGTALARYSNCVTTKAGPVTNAPCVFPFKFKGKTYTYCTCVGYEKASNPWCSTKVNPSTQEHVQGQWGECDTTVAGCGTKCTQPNAMQTYLVSQPITSYHFNIACPSGLNLISCGIVQSNEGQLFNDDRRMLMDLPSLCYCYATFRGNCTAWCADRVLSVELAGNVLYPPATEMRAQCKEGQKVTGCYYATERYGPAFPSPDGTSCIYQDTIRNRIRGEVTCAPAASIANYEISSATGNDNVVATCSLAGNVAIGCGIKPTVVGSGQPAYMAHSVTSATTCACAFPGALTCYVICGQIV